MHTAVLSPAPVLRCWRKVLCWGWVHCLEQSIVDALVYTVLVAVVWHCLKFWLGGGGELPAELCLVMRPGFAAAQPSPWVKVSTADWKASNTNQGFARCGITWLRTIVLRHIKFIFVRLVPHSALVLSKVVRAIISQKSCNCRYPFS